MQDTFQIFEGLARRWRSGRTSGPDAPPASSCSRLAPCPVAIFDLGHMGPDATLEDVEAYLGRDEAPR